MENQQSDGKKKYVQWLLTGILPEDLSQPLQKLKEYIIHQLSSYSIHHLQLFIKDFKSVLIRKPNDFSKKTALLITGQPHSGRSSVMRSIFKENNDHDDDWVAYEPIRQALPVDFMPVKLDMDVVQLHQSTCLLRWITYLSQRGINAHFLLSDLNMQTPTILNLSIESLDYAFNAVEALMLTQLVLAIHFNHDIAMIPQSSFLSFNAIIALLTDAEYRIIHCHIRSSKTANQNAQLSRLKNHYRKLSDLNRQSDFGDCYPKPDSGRAAFSIFHRGDVLQASPHVVDHMKSDDKKKESEKIDLILEDTVQPSYSSRLLNTYCVLS
ncbi:MAG: hypothetical protein CMF42_05985 [Legionellales bacterium]|nr:hypothetical protein [Legionellales bacterium]OUX66961.1 MAG: hypothetical protein CBD38_04330 [bacterium TMED178]